MAEFVRVTHPDLPGQVALMAAPRNGWEPAPDEEPKPKAKRRRAAKKTPAAKKAAESAPTAGTDTP